MSRAMLSQVERGNAAPTITVLWRIACALHVQISSLLQEGATPPRVLRAEVARSLTSPGGSVTTRALFVERPPRNVEFYEIRLTARGIERCEPQPPGTTCSLVLANGALTVFVGGHREDLKEGDAVMFGADVAHEYRNEGATPARAFVVVTHEGMATDPFRT